jgi:hypothetical protein
MSEETQENEGTWSGLKKTLLGTVATVVTAGGAWLGSTLFGGGNEETTQQPAQSAPVINITNSNQQQQSNNGGTTIIKERVIEKTAPAPTPVQAAPAQKESW